MSEIVEQQAHICSICEQSFMNDSDVLKVCPKCFQKHNLDIAFEEIFERRQDEVLEGFMSLSEKNLKKNIAIMDEVFTKSRKKLKRIQIFNLFYLLVGLCFFLLSNFTK